MKKNKKILAGIIIALAIVATNLQYAIDNYGINNWGLGLEAVASATSGGNYAWTPEYVKCSEWKWINQATGDIKYQMRVECNTGIFLTCTLEACRYRD